MALCRLGLTSCRLHRQCATRLHAGWLFQVRAEAATSAHKVAHQPVRDGAHIVSGAKHLKKELKDQSAEAGKSQGIGKTTTGGDPEAQTRLQLQRLFRELPRHSGPVFAYLLHSQGKLQPKVDKPLKEEEFVKIFRHEKYSFQNKRRAEVLSRRRRRRNYFQLNEGYKEELESHEAVEEAFQDHFREESIIEDWRKAEYYKHIHREAWKDVPEHEPLAQRGDRLRDIAAAAFRRNLIEQNRPVLTHELADFENPYLMKHSAMERLLQERCVRNKLDERCLPRLLERQPDLVKLRAEAALPPEVLEPLAAFRGDTQWHFDARERLLQKLTASTAALQAVVETGGKRLEAVASVLPENNEVPASKFVSVQHPWKHHIGFESVVPRGVAGGLRFGQPMADLEAEVLRLRYPTLQRVAHTLPQDPKWRAHVVRAIRVLERSKHWDYESKLAAVNKLKEVYDNLKPSAEYNQGLDEKLPINRMPKHLRRKYAPDTRYVKTFPKNFLKKKSSNNYCPSLTAVDSQKKAKK